MYYMGLSVNRISICLKGILWTDFFFVFIQSPQANLICSSIFHLTLCVIYFIYMTGLCDMRMTPISEGTLDSSCCLSRQARGDASVLKEGVFLPLNKASFTFRPSHPRSHSVIVIFGLNRHQHHKHHKFEEQPFFFSHKPEKDHEVITAKKKKSYLLFVDMRSV